jgi:hypothetical protein
MGTIIFCVLSAAGCVFLIYVMMHFQQELIHLQKKSSVRSLTYLGSFESELVRAESSFSPSREQPPQVHHHGQVAPS